MHKFGRESIPDSGMLNTIELHSNQQDNFPASHEDWQNCNQEAVLHLSDTCTAKLLLCDTVNYTGSSHRIRPLNYFQARMELRHCVIRLLMHRLFYAVLFHWVH